MNPSPTQNATFASLGLPPEVLANLEQLGYQAMTPIQAAALPPALLGQDVIAQAKTGSGKTAAFGLALLDRLNPRLFAVQAMVLCPTRELADQVAGEIRRLARAQDNIKLVTLCGGVPLRAQLASLEHGAHIVVGTPGRVMDHLDRQSLDLGALKTLVLDEADRMLDIGFLPDLQRILSYLPKTRTTLLFSATFSPEIKRLASSYLQNPITIEVARPNETASTVEQRFYSANDDDKRRAIHQVLKTRGIKQAFIFVNSKLGCARLARSLEREGLKTAALHGDKSQDERLKALDAFKKGEVDLLVCTDVAARGLDIKDVPAVFNFDVPFNAEDYVHRIGRTGRAGAAGLAVTFVSKSDARLVGDIEKLIKTKIELEAVEFEENLPDIRKQGRINDGRRMYAEGAQDDSRRESRQDGRRSGAMHDVAHEGQFARPDRAERAPRRDYTRPAPASRDPFFDKPYEPSATPEVAATPSWEAAAVRPGARAISANIKPKRRVAALFKSEPKAEFKAEPATEPSTESV
eukprot:gene16169-biopygen9057